ncbi:unnamed protein product, partial [Oikopleura dioica]
KYSKFSFRKFFFLKQQKNSGETTDQLRQTKKKQEVKDLSSQVNALLRESTKDAIPRETAIRLLKVTCPFLGANQPVSKRLAAFEWIISVFRLKQDQIEDEFPWLMLQVFSAINLDENEKVRKSGMNCLTEIANLNDKTFDTFIEMLYSSLNEISAREDRQKVAFVVRKLCEKLGGEKIYLKLGSRLIFHQETAAKIATIQLLNLLLGTAPELHDFRRKLRERPSEVMDNFNTVWKAWISCPISSLCLALLGRRYQLAYSTVKTLAEMNLNSAHLCEIDRLIQLLESPGFTWLRFELLEKPPALIASLRGILMILPQSKAFDLLQKRLSLIPSEEPFNPNSSSSQISSDDLALSKMLSKKINL